MLLLAENPASNIQEKDHTTKARADWCLQSDAVSARSFCAICTPYPPHVPCPSQRPCPSHADCGLQSYAACARSTSSGPRQRDGKRRRGGRTARHPELEPGTRPALFAWALLRSLLRLCSADQCRAAPSSLSWAAATDAREVVAIPPSQLPVTLTLVPPLPLPHLLPFPPPSLSWGRLHVTALPPLRHRCRSHSHS